ncbi:transposase [Hydrogenivirga sp. 128-5-R1-1]|uniref:transposase n=1 Tax=Hydrogenivirga sp. 128-5-R1-1 TaxID=392423 RepID=UPI00015EF0F7|nr:transposase [Hydrogenivirga sp. 128-5-R1-1]EDP74698.1 hypothetical protein HG1285_14839 [Hydrogenivirga sp. 128-5-R1-1]
MNEAKYNALLNIFSHSLYILSSSPTYSASTLSRFLSSPDFNPMPQIQSLIYQLLAKLSSSHKAFLIADTTLLRKTGSKIEGVNKLYDPSSKRIVLAHRALVIILSVGNLRVPLHVELLRDVKPVDALIEALKRLLHSLKRLFPNLLFLCDAGLTCNRLLEFLLSEEVDFVCAISQGRVDRESKEKLRDLWFPRPERVKLKGLSKPLYAHRVGEGDDKEKVVVSNKALSKKRFGDLYKHRWQVESEIKVLKVHGLESYMVRKLRAIRLWIMAVWHVVLLKLRSKLNEIGFRKYMLSLAFPPIVVELVEVVEFIQEVLRRCLKFFPFPDDRLFLLMFQNLTGGHSCCEKVWF